jgi:energy-coupling factor transporter ATP-binding protein EcfA2
MITAAPIQPITLQDAPRSQSAHTASPFAPYQEMARALRAFLQTQSLPADVSPLKLFMLQDDVFDAAVAWRVDNIWTDARWFQPDLFGGPHAFDHVTDRPGYTPGIDKSPLQVEQTGICFVPQESIAVYRVHCLDKDLRKSRLNLAAAPDADRLIAFLTRLDAYAQSQRRVQKRWTVMRSGYQNQDGTLIDNAPALSDLVLSDTLQKTFQQQLCAFFTQPVQDLHAKLNLPKSRKTILYGPPGTGKTTLSRAIARAIPSIAAYHLTPNEGFDSDDMDRIYRKVLEDGPSLLLIEDIDTLVGGSAPTINVSNFLNLLDGVNSPRSGPTLLLATTNHPDKLPESLINRPGRFMPIEIPLPDRALRLRYLQQGLPAQPQDVLDQAASRSQGLSFAHLQEVILLSGILAMNDNRDTRQQTDIFAALKHINTVGENTRMGFPTSSNRPFGFTPRDTNRDTDAA